MSTSENITIQIKGKTPIKYEQYLTKDKVAAECIEFLIECINDLFKVKIVTSKLRNSIDLSYFKTIIDPCCGEGAFVRVIGEHDNLFYFDIDAIDPEYRHDYLKLEDELLIHKKPYLTIMSPPFGKDNCLVINFFNKAAKYSSVIAIVVPFSFNQPSVINSLNINFHKICQLTMPKNSFIFKGKDHNSNCEFQVWIKSTSKLIDGYSIEREKI